MFIHLRMSSFLKAEIMRSKIIRFIFFPDGWLIRKRLCRKT